MGRRLISLMAAAAISIVGVVAFVATPSSAAPTSVATFTQCDGPEQEVSETAAKSIVKDINPTACLDIQVVHKCDKTTVVTMTNWAFNDNKFTVLTVEIDGKEYTLKGGSDPNTEVVVLGPPAIEDVQAKLVFRFTTPDGELTLKKNYGDPWTWEEPKACVSPSPSASVTASPSPSASASTSAPATTASSTTTGPALVPAGNDDLPVTGASTTALIVAAFVLFAAAGTGVVLRRRRRNTETVA